MRPQYQRIVRCYVAMNLMVGGFGEAYAHRQFVQAGYEVACPTEKKQGDLRIKNPNTGEVLRIEVKTSQKGVRGWCVCLNKAGKTSVEHSDMVVLQLVTRAGYVVSYFIPSELLINKKSISFRRADSPNSKWAQYRKPDYRVFGGVM